MDKLQQLLNHCKSGVYLTVNEHRDYYQSAQEALLEAELDQWPPQISEEVKGKMIETNTIIHLQFYPDTPIGFYQIWHYDLEAALIEALKCLAL